MMMLKGGKGGGAQCFRVQNGRPVIVTEAMIAEVELDPEQMVSAHAGLVGVRVLGAGWGRRGDVVAGSSHTTPPRAKLTPVPCPRRSKL